MKTPLQIFRTHYTDTSLPILESQVLAAMDEYKRQDCRHEFVTCDANGKIDDVLPDRDDYRAICIKCRYMP